MTLKNLLQGQVSDARKAELDRLAKELAQLDPGTAIQFICTHNSRRSHLCEIMFRTASLLYGVEAKTLSGGTEGTALYPTVAEALKQLGFNASSEQFKGQLAWKIAHPKVQQLEEVALMYSKTYDEAAGSEPMAAIMVCDSANEGCPFIPNALLRAPLLYVDPKWSDGSEQELATYVETAKLIAAEMGYLVRALKQ